MVYKLHKQYRLPGYDYSQSGTYFITVCTKDRECYLGKIVDDKMVLSETGKVAQMFWQEIPERFKNIRLDAWVIMPNHVHGILVVNGPLGGRAVARPPNGGHSYGGETPGIHPLVKNSISSIINHFKGNVKRYCNKNNIEFAWQARFHDHIIRNERGLNIRRRYIAANPERWERDRNKE
ncbi:MAG: transposase [Bacillota bacterium]